MNEEPDGVALCSIEHPRPKGWYRRLYWWLQCEPTYGYFRGATMYEAWLWRFYIRLPYWHYLRVGCRPYVGFDSWRAEDNE